MEGKVALLSLAFLATICCLEAATTTHDAKVVCYYDSKAYFRDGQGKFDVPFLEPALQFCTHLVYKSAGINADNFKLMPLNENFDVTKDNYRKITELKRRYPTLKVLLSVGGGDDDQTTEKYLTLLESVDHRIAFVNSAANIVKTFGFDGLDLAWQLPTVKPKKIRGKISSFFHGLKKKIVGSSKVDEKEEEHKEQFTALVRETKNVFKHDGLLVTVTVLPNVNSSIYMDTRLIMQNADFVNLMAFDYRTPKRNPKEADYSAPLYALIDRNEDENGNALVKHWLDGGAPNNKLILGLPTYGRVWKMTEDSAISGVPPFEVDGAAELGPYTKHEGLYSYPEVCAKLANPNNLKANQGTHLRKIGDPSKRYDGWSVIDVSNRYGQGKFDVPFLEPALQFCTHLVYKSAGINADNFKLMPLNENFDVTKDNYRKITELKRRYPTLKVLLSVGGGDDDQTTEKYLTLLESVDHRIAFVNSAANIVKTFGFDGLDLAWQLPTVKPKKIRGKISSFFHGLKKKIVGSSKVDEKEEEHKEQFTALVRETKNVFKHDGLLVTVTVLPNVNSSIYMDTRLIMQNADFVNLMAFDYRTPKRNPKEADYSAPLYALIDRNEDENGNALVKHWLDGGAPNNKLILGLPTYGRVWKMTEDSAISGVPPFEVDGAAELGPYTKHEGLYSYPEVCAKLANPNNLKANQGTHLRKIGDPSKRYDGWSVIDVSNRYGTYAFRLPDENGENGSWVSYEDPDTAGNKAAYVRDKGLGGIAIYDITLDDFRGLCTGDKYPILRSAKLRL